MDYKFLYTFIWKYIFYLSPHNLLVRATNPRLFNRIEISKIFEDIFIFFYGELKISFNDDFRKGQKSKDNHRYISLNLAQIIIKDLFEFEFTADEMIDILKSCEARRCAITQYMESEKARDYEFSVMLDEIAEGEYQINEDKKQMGKWKVTINPQVNTTRNGLLTWMRQIDPSVVYLIYTSCIEKNVFPNIVNWSNHPTYNLIWNHFMLFVYEKIIMKDFGVFYRKLNEQFPEGNIIKESLWWNRYTAIDYLLKCFDDHSIFFKRIFWLPMFKRKFQDELGVLNRKR